MDDVAKVGAAEDDAEGAEDLGTLRGNDPSHHGEHADGAERNDEGHHALDDRVEGGDHILREKFDLIFLDPPYADNLLERAVAHIARFDILAPDGIMIAESPAEKELPKLSAPYRVAREYRYGRIKVTLYRRDGEETT